jgi:chaperonin GroEL
MLESLDAPIKTILKNAGESVDLIVARILENSDPSYGYDVLNKKYCNMIDAGVIDPASVIISEVENASSIAGLLLTTSGAIVNIPEESNAGGCSCGH